MKTCCQFFVGGGRWDLFFKKTYENNHAVSCCDGSAQGRHDGVQQRVRARLDVRNTGRDCVGGSIFAESDKVLVGVGL